MSPRSAAAAVARVGGATIHAPARTRTPLRPAPARRRSGAAAGTRVRPRYDYVSVLDRLLRGPLYIALVGVLLAGIVFFNVGLLELNHGIASTDTRSAQLKRQNAALTLQLAKLGSSERIQRVALARGLVLPQPGDVRYLRAGSGDAARALRVMTAPNSSAASATTAPALVSQQSTPTTATTAPTTTTPATTTPTATTPTATTPTATQTPVSATTTTPTTATTPVQTTTPAGATATTTATPAQP